MSEVADRRAAVVGSPIEHSKSPLLHRAAFAALGLHGWTYDRIECDESGFPGLIAGLGQEWIGLSVTMPDKLVALTVADEVTDRAALVGSANTLVRTDTGWRADCTDIDGVTGALRDAAVSDLSGACAVVLGAGGTARPALVALADLGVRRAAVVSRDRHRAAGALACGERAGLDVRWLGFEDGIEAAVSVAAVVISTVPATATAPVLGAVAGARVLLDAIYDPWPTPLAAAVERRGGLVIGGLSMLLNQAYGQIEQFTGRQPPRAAMARALQISQS